MKLDSCLIYGLLILWAPVSRVSLSYQELSSTHDAAPIRPRTDLGGVIGGQLSYGSIELLDENYHDRALGGGRMNIYTLGRLCFAYVF